MDFRKTLHDHWLMLLGSIACLTLAFAFAYVGEEVMAGSFRGLDVAVREWVAAHQHTGLRRAFVLVTYLGTRAVLIPLGIVVGWPLLRGYWSWLVLLLFCVLASSELVSILKDGFEVLRPPLGMENHRSFSFPSGHTTAAATAAAVLGYLALRRRRHHVAYIAGGAALVLAVAVSRVYLEEHWTTDVIGGMLIGSTFAVGCCAMYQWLKLGFTTIRRRRYATSQPLPG
jgi:MYXO-CTERM domain-containing protein